MGSGGFIADDKAAEAWIWPLHLVVKLRRSTTVVQTPCLSSWRAHGYFDLDFNFTFSFTVSNYLPSCSRRTLVHGGPSVIFWAAISASIFPRQHHHIRSCHFAKTEVVINSVQCIRPVLYVSHWIRFSCPCSWCKGKVVWYLLLFAVAYTHKTVTANQFVSSVAPLDRYINKGITWADKPIAFLNHWRRSPLRLNFLIRCIPCLLYCACLSRWWVWTPSQGI